MNIHSNLLQKRPNRRGGLLTEGLIARYLIPNKTNLVCCFVFMVVIGFGTIGFVFAGQDDSPNGPTSSLKQASVGEGDAGAAKSSIENAPSVPEIASPSKSDENQTQEETGSQGKEETEVVSHQKENAGDLLKPFGSEDQFAQRMAKERGEDTGYLHQRYQRAIALIQNEDLYREKETKAFLMTPREKFCRKWNLKRAYEHAFLDIGFGVTISGPHLVGRMTSALDVHPGDKVLEIGTGSGYQSAVLAGLTDKVYTIEIIEKLAGQTDKLYTELAESGYPEYGKITRKADDGYYGWEEYAPFDKIIVTCGIDHIPPPLLKQLNVGGSMVIPVGPPGAQVVLKVTKTQDEDGSFVISREDIYRGKRKVPFVPFTKKGGGTHFK